MFTSEGVMEGVRGAGAAVRLQNRGLEGRGWWEEGSLMRKYRRPSSHGASAGFFLQVDG